MLVNIRKFPLSSNLSINAYEHQSPLQALTVDYISSCRFVHFCNAWLVKSPTRDLQLNKTGI
jgi:hypothetical protein